MRELLFSIICSFMFCLIYSSTTSAEVYSGYVQGKTFWQEKNMSAVIGKRWVIKCENVSGAINWTRNNEYIPELASGEIITMHKSGNYFLRALRADERHVGNYSCISESNESFYIDIYKTEVYSGPRVVFANSNVVINCTGFGSNQVRWMFDRDWVDMKDNHMALQAMDVEMSRDGLTSYLMITSIKDHHSGIYSCVPYTDNYFELKVLKDGCFGTSLVSVGDPWNIQCRLPKTDHNEYNMITSESYKKLILWASSSGKIQYIGYNTRDLSDSVDITCMGFDSISKIHWTKKGQSILDDMAAGRMQVRTTTSQSSLTIQSLQRHHSGIYTCVNDSQDTFEVVVNEDCIGVTHRFVLSKSEYLECLKRRFGWSRNNQLIDTTIEYVETLDSTSNTYNLYASKATEKHTGLYRYLTDSKAEFHFLLVTSGDKIFYSGTRDRLEGDRANITCIGFRPEDKIHWLKNGQQIYDELAAGEIIVKNYEQYSELIILEARKRHSGNYSCIPSRNDSFPLLIKKDEISGRPYVERGTPWSLEFQGIPGTEIKWMRDGIDSLNMISRHIKVFTSQSGRSKISSEFATDEHQGHYTCSAHSNKSFFLAVIVKEYPHSNVPNKNGDQSSAFTDDETADEVADEVTIPVKGNNGDQSHQPIGCIIALFLSFLLFQNLC